MDACGSHLSNGGKRYLLRALFGPPGGPEGLVARFQKGLRDFFIGWLITSKTVKIPAGVLRQESCSSFRLSAVGGGAEQARQSGFYYK